MATQSAKTKYINSVDGFDRLLHRFQSSMVLKPILGLLWYLLHIPHLAVVVNNEEAKHTTKIKQLLCWLSAIGVKHVTLYDMEGVMKKSIEIGLKSLTNPSIGTCFDADVSSVTSLHHHEGMAIELLSFSDGKDGIAKAASFLCSKYLKVDSEASSNTESIFTEDNMEKALKSVGYFGPEPDLLLVYGPARCHLGFPPWRLRYTEIVHMGPLKSMKYGGIVKAIYDFSKKHQNFGS
ncbi:uncharacterized protein [Typha latifolia]|uniref:uncharacterized protein n=1 Tax=Typha latifolia TaxID=4733 RepID=UPI003C2C7525